MFETRWSVSCVIASADSLPQVGLRALSRLMSSEEAQRRSGSAKGAQGSSTRLISAAAAALEACRDSAGVAQASHSPSALSPRPLSPRSPPS